MEIEGSSTEKALVVRLKGRMDAVAAPEFDKKCSEWLAGGMYNVVLDFSDLEYISSIGLRSILVLGKQIKGQNGKLHLCSLNKTVGGVFQMSGFAAIFPVFDSLKPALEKI
ncbi:MAG: STAS domain-containing protein [Syntrophobacteraceae bacterium]